MLGRSGIITAIGCVCLFVSHSASAQPRWGRERVPNQGACFYEDANFRGDYFCVRQGDRLPSLPSGMADKISSVRVLGSAEVTVFRDSGMRGRSARFIDDVRNLKGEGWNDQISSIDVTSGRDYTGFGGWGGNGNGNGNGNGRARGRNRNADNGRWGTDRTPVWGRNERMPSEGACFYEDSNFRGQYFCVPRGATFTSLPRGFNDRISSVRVFGADVRIFQDRDFRGHSREISRDLPNLRGDWKDDVSSIRVF
jgi:peptidase inhibitor family I36